MPRPNDFRFIYTNAVGLGISDNEFRFMFAFAEDLSNAAENTEQVGVIMSHRTAKFLLNILKDSIESYETASGIEIPFDAERFAELREKMVIKSAEDATDAEPLS